MKNKMLIGACLMSLSLALTSHAACPVVKRSRTVLRHFQAMHPCPSTGLTTGGCPGYILDHQIPLCLTGQRGDTVTNLQWQSVSEAKAKDLLEKDLCRTLCACLPVPAPAHRKDGTP